MTKRSRYELTADDGSPAERMAKRSRLYAQPRVATLTRASELLGVPEAELARRVQAVGLEAWGRHASGANVFRWPALQALARQDSKK